MWKLFVIVSLSLAIVICSLLFFLKITLIVLGVSIVALFTLFKLAPLKSDKPAVKKDEAASAKPFHREKITA